MQLRPTLGRECKPEIRNKNSLSRRYPGTVQPRRKQQRPSSLLTTAIDAKLLAVEVCVATIVVGVAWFPGRPRGWAAKDLVEVKQSPVAGKGVFARQQIHSGTVIGAYPGVPRSNNEMLQKVERRPRAAAYVFATDSGYLDPTDQDGWPVDKLLWVNASMAFVNEPPVGAAVNVEIVDGNSSFDLLFVSTKDVPAGEELYLDYGRSYDRSSYNHTQSK